jgi:hypothetical protein
VRKRQEQRQQKDTGTGFSFMNALNIWNNKKEEEIGNVAVEK